MLLFSPPSPKVSVLICRVPLIFVIQKLKYLNTKPPESDSTITFI